MADAPSSAPACTQALRRLPIIGEAQWPAQIYDSKAVNPLGPGPTPRSMVLDRPTLVCGVISAGAHLVLMLGVSGNVPELGATSAAIRA